MVEALRRGDQVVTSGGLIGKVTKVADSRRGRGRARAERQGAGGALDHQPGGQQDRARRGVRPAAARPPPGDLTRRCCTFRSGRSCWSSGSAVLGILIALPNAFYGRVERANDARAAIAAGAAATPELAADAALWPRWLPHRLINLGLDLRGGAHVLVQVETAEVYAERHGGAVARPARPAARPARPGRHRAPAGRAAGRAAHPARPARRAWTRRCEAVRGGGAAGLLDHRRRQPRVRGPRRGRHAGRDADRRPRRRRSTRAPCSRASRSSAAASTRPAPASRRSSARAPTASWCRCRASARPRSCSQVIGQTAQLSFHPVVSRTHRRERPAGARRGGLPVAWTSPASSTCWSGAAVVTGDQLVDSQPSFDQNGRPAVTFRFNPAGGAAFGAYTAREHRQAVRHRARRRGDLGAGDPGAHLRRLGHHHRQLHARGVVAAGDPAARRRAAGRDHRARAAHRRAGARRRLDRARAAWRRWSAFVGIIAFMVATYGFFGVIASVGMVMNIVLPDRADDAARGDADHARHRRPRARRSAWRWTPTC